MSEEHHGDDDVRLARAGGDANASSMEVVGADFRAQAEQSSHTNEPLVSIILFVRNGMPHLRRAVTSVLVQDYANFEYVVQDGGSTDGTLDYLKSIDDPRIKVVSQKDDGPADAFSRALSRCNGEILASCLADEELVPGALSRAVEVFNKYPHLGAITGDAHVSDIDGHVYAKFTGAPFNMLNYLNGEYCPYWCSSFFSMSALRFVGVFDKRWSKASLEFEIWCRLAMETDILYVPEIFSKYAHHAGQLSQAGDRVEEELEARIEIIRKHMFGPGKYFGEDQSLCDAFTLMQLINLHRHLSIWNDEAAKKTYQRIVDSNYLAEFNALRAPDSEASSTAAGDSKNLIPAAAPAISPTQAVGGGRSKFIPLHEHILPRHGRAGKLYQTVTPSFVRKMVPRELKVKIAQMLGIGGR